MWNGLYKGEARCSKTVALVVSKPIDIVIDAVFVVIGVVVIVVSGLAVAVKIPFGAVHCRWLFGINLWLLYEPLSSMDPRKKNNILEAVPAAPTNNYSSCSLRQSGGTSNLQKRW